MDFFDLSKPFKRVEVAGGASQRYAKRTEPDSDDDEAMSTTETGTEYVTEYVEADTKRFLEEVHRVRSTGQEWGSVSDLISQGTVPNINDINMEEVTKIYKTFNFSYRPKSNLTITPMQNHIVSMIETNQCVVIAGPTGCGKTTQVPQFILNSCFDKKIHCNIIVTQPRRIAAISIAKRVSEERQWPVGTLVGYQVGMVNNTSQDTRLTYCTTGVLLQKLINSKHLMDYTHIVLDEVHERDQDMDFLLLVVRKLSRMNSHTVKIVLMSATFDVDKFSAYFSIPLGKKLYPAHVIDISKDTFFRINTLYLNQLRELEPHPVLDKNEPGVSDKMMKLCLKLIMKLDHIDRQECMNAGRALSRSVILVFLPGIFEIEEMFSILTTPETESFLWDVVVMHSSITNEEQQRIFEMPPTGYRRIILSTNISESSITVPDVKYVIDFCLTKQLVTDPRTNFQCLEMVWASKASCKQRAGRTGRVMDGRVYRLVPERFYEEVLPKEGAPEMLRAPLENLVLNAKILEMGEPKAILALSLDPPDLSNLERTILLLKEVGGLLDLEDRNLDKKYDGYLTDLGRIMAKLPVDIRIAKLFVLGHVFSVLKESIVIGASMSVKSMFSTPFKERLKAYNGKLTWADSSGSDCVAYLNVYNVWIRNKMKGRFNAKTAEKAWAQSHFIQLRVLREVDAMVQDIEKRLERMGITATTGGERISYSEVEKPLVIKIVIAGALYPHYFVRRAEGGESDEREAVKMVGGNDPTNSVYLQGWPMQQPGLLYARQIQNIFKDCLSSPVANTIVSFDGSSRVYIQFYKNHETVGNEKQPKAPGKISLSVYKALKMRQSKEPIQVKVLDPYSASKRAEELGIPIVNVTSLQRKDESKSRICSRPAFSPILPSLDISYIPIIISEIEDPSCFWAQTLDVDTQKKIDKIKKLIVELEPNLPPMTSKWPIGSLVLAPFDKDEYGTLRYYRASIISYHCLQQDTLAEVFYIDYGNRRKVHIRELKPVDVDNELSKIPSQAYKCVLANVQPSMLQNVEGQWSDKAMKEFRKLLDEKKTELFGEIFSVVDSVVAINLIRVDANKEKLDINKYLIEQGYAEFKEESYLSRSNNEHRNQQADQPLDVETKRYHEEQQYSNNYENQAYPAEPLESHFSDIVRLKGPFSPLEMELVNLVSAGRTKKIKIEPNSVNSILLDTNPADYHERLLVAGTVSQNVTGERLSLRNTTLMPNIHGLPSLISLVFAPTIELRRSTQGSKYIGALCGLGYDKETNKSLFPDHDMNVVFDVQITLQDLQDINRLRHWMNMAIHIDTNMNGEKSDIAMCQKKAKETLFTLIGKKRKSQPMQIPYNAMKWNQNDESIILAPAMTAPATSLIFRLHSALELVELPEGYEEMCVHLLELRRIAAGLADKVPAEIECQLCQVTVSSVLMLRGHLNSTEHKKNRDDANIQLR